MDRIHLRGLEVFAHHGVFEFEEEQGQVFVVDVSLEVDLTNAGASDELTSTVDYGELARVVRARVKDERHNLIERVAQRVADAVLDHPLVNSVDVSVHKPGAPIPVAFSDVVVEIHRTK